VVDAIPHTGVMSSPIDSAKKGRAPSNPPKDPPEISLHELEQRWANNIRLVRGDSPGGDSSTQPLRRELAILVAAHRKAATAGNG
jgi:hypothetical protein